MKYRKKAQPQRSRQSRLARQEQVEEWNPRNGRQRYYAGMTVDVEATEEGYRDER